jgi:hypothetical protein
MMKEFNGSEMPLDKKSPLRGEFDDRAGKPEMQMVGSKCDLSRTPVEDFRSEVSEGTRQTVASEAPMGRTPVKGWDSYPTPMSERAKKQQGDGK